MNKFDNQLKILKKTYPHTNIQLKFSNNFELLVAVILSAQCTDERVIIVTKKLFKKYKRISDYANAKVKEFENDIRSTGFYRNKTKNIIGSAKLLVKSYGGKVPNSMNELLKFPGVGRKTANIVLYYGFGIVTGVPVDTHVWRLSNRLGFSSANYPDKIEEDLMKHFPKNSWRLLSEVLISHGRKVCKARKPECGSCVLNKLCPSAFKLK